MEISTTTVAIGIGGTWGDGILTLKDGSQHAFSMRGLDVASVGVTTFEATGNVYHLKDLEDFTGTYSSIGAGLAIAKGLKGTTMQNPEGVVINISSTTTGLGVEVGPRGVEFKLEQ